MDHYCHAIMCEMVVPPHLLCCPQHWRMIPLRLRMEVVRAYRPGQERDKRPSPAYLQAAARAICAVAEQEGRDIPAFYRKMASGEYLTSPP